jgi:hypothetical protein
MLAGVPRLVLVALLILGLLMPRISAVAASVVPGVSMVVICTGQGVITLRIDENGNPVPLADHSDHCLLAHAADTAPRMEGAPVHARVAEAVPRPTGDLIRAESHRATRPPPRAPPA